MIDTEGYRANVGIILSNSQGRVFWARRVGEDAWQFPQGGIRSEETPEQAMYRELAEETGLFPRHVEIVGYTSRWLKYKLPKRYMRKHVVPLCVGQKQLWYMLRLLEHDDCVNLSHHQHPEFEEWCWVDYWHPMSKVIFFKRSVYQKALTELAPLIFEPGQVPQRPSS